MAGCSNYDSVTTPDGNVVQFSVSTERKQTNSVSFLTTLTVQVATTCVVRRDHYCLVVT